MTSSATGDSRSLFSRGYELAVKRKSFLLETPRLGAGWYFDIWLSAWKSGSGESFLS